MNSIYIDIKHQIFWLSYEWFLNHNVSENTLSQWSKRKVCTRKYINGRAYINYDTIPEPTRIKLPNKEQIKEENKRRRKAYLYDDFTKELQEVHRSGRVMEWINIILKDEMYKKLKRPQVTEFARHAAVIERAAEMQSTYTAMGVLDALFYAYSTLYPDKYSLKNRFCMALKQAREEGVLSVAIDNRAIREFTSKYGATHEYAAEYVLSMNKAHSLPDCYDYLEQFCNGMGLEVPGFDWLKRYWLRNKHIIERNRLGEMEWQQKYGTYAKIIPALHRNSQWQIDGWKVPVFCKRLKKDGGHEKWIRPTLFCVLDAHSRRIIGWELQETETKETILKGLEDAVKTTSVLPYEIVADNHSWNQTKESEYFKNETERLGVHWTIDSNPRRKGILERAFRTLGEKHFKKRYGYIGQGVKTKMKYGRTQQELIDQYTKNLDRFLDFDQVKALCMVMISEYNRKVKPSLGESPDARYERSEQPKCTPIDEFVQMAIFNRRSEYKVAKGQITIKNGMHTYEYQLPAAYSVQYNGKTVGVRYVDFNEVYLYDLETDNPLCCIEQKSVIHGALADQTEQDVDQLNKNAGRIKGINSKSRKRKESIFGASDSISPDAHGYLNEVTAPKEIVDEIRQSKELSREAQKRGLNMDRTAPLPKVDEMLDNDLKPKQKESKKRIFMPEKVQEIGILKIEE